MKSRRIVALDTKEAAMNAALPGGLNRTRLGSFIEVALPGVFF
jgi:hypothetical protein